VFELLEQVRFGTALVQHLFHFGSLLFVLQVLMAGLITEETLEAGVWNFVGFFSMPTACLHAEYLI
jgi:hypothetical protein